MGNKRKKKKKMKKIAAARDWNTVSAIMRISAGPMKSKKDYKRNPKETNLEDYLNEPI